MLQRDLVWKAEKGRSHDQKTDEVEAMMSTVARGQQRGRTVPSFCLEIVTVFWFHGMGSQLYCNHATPQQKGSRLTHRTTRDRIWSLTVNTQRAPAFTLSVSTFASLLQFTGLIRRCMLALKQVRVGSLNNPVHLQKG